MRQHRERKRPTDDRHPQQAVALAWLVAGLGLNFAFFLTVPLSGLEISLAPIVVYLLAVLGLDLFVGSNRSQEVTLQRISPAVVLGLLLTPGIPPALVLVVDLVATLSVAATSPLTSSVLAQSGKALFPASLTAFYLPTREELTPETYFFACWIFIVVALLFRAKTPPFRTDVFLIVSYPAVALLLRYLIGLNLTYVLLAVPLLFMLTTVNATYLPGYFQLKQKLDDSQTEIRESRRAQRQTEMEAKRKGILLMRKEQQLSLLNGLGREMDASEKSVDLGRFLLKESVRLTGAETALLLLCDPGSGRIVRILCDYPQHHWGLKEGESVPETIRPGISAKPPWQASLWQQKRSFITCRLGLEGWLFMGKAESDAFPQFLAEFFSAVGRHAGSAILALRRLSEVREVALREAREKQNVAREKEKVAEQNRNLRLLLESFDSVADGNFTSEQELIEKASQALTHLTGADRVVFRAQPIGEYRPGAGGLKVDAELWPGYLYCPGGGSSGNVLLLSKTKGTLSESQLEWCALLLDFLDKTMENSNLQQEMVVTSQWAAAGRLAANAAHELNTPLGAIHIAADHISMFLERGGNPEPAKESMVSLMNSVHRCRGVTDRLLITSRPVDRGSSPSRPSGQKLAPIVKDAVASVRPYLRASKIKFVEPDPPPDQMVSVVLQDLYWAVVNVIKNGIDALNEGPFSDKTIELRVQQVGQLVEVRITDNGPGVPGEVKPKLFEPFFTTKKLGQGNGLGLSLSRTNLMRWGGDIEFLDTPGGGATFVLKLPVA